MGVKLNLIEGCRAVVNTIILNHIKMEKEFNGLTTLTFLFFLLFIFFIELNLVSLELLLNALLIFRNEKWM